MTQKRRLLILAISLLVLLCILSLAGLSVRSRHLREREEIRRLVATALAERSPTSRTSELFRQAGAFDEAYVACEEGMRLRDQGLFTEAAESFRACVHGDPDLLAANLAWAEARSLAEGRDSYQEIRDHLRHVVATARRDDPALPEATALLHDLEDLLAATHPANPRGWSAEDIEEILTRPWSRGRSRYDGPRLALRFGFRPGDTDLGSAAEPELRQVAWALTNGLLARARIQVEGHTDSVEGESASGRRELARRRAEAVRDFLVRQCGVPGGRLRAVGLGGDYPADSNATEEGRALNRRVELVNLETKEPLREDARRRP